MGVLEVSMNADEVKKKKAIRYIAERIHYWFSGYNMKNCPHGENCGAFKSAMAEAKRIYKGLEKGL